MKFLLYIALFLIATPSFSQDSVSVLLKNNTIRIGEQTELKLQFFYHTIDSLPIEWPIFENDLISDKIEIISQSDIKTKPLDSTSAFNFVDEQLLIITSFEPDSLTIPVLYFIHQDSTYQSSLKNFIVNTVSVDTSKQIFDIKPIIEIDYSKVEKIKDWGKDNWYWFLIIALVIVLTILVIFIKKRPKIEVEKPKIIIPAHIKALNVLNQLKQDRAWESDDKKQYYSNLTDAVRLYLEDRYKIQALEKTTREIIADLKYVNISVDDKYFLREILKQADYVKFAKLKPENEDGRIALEKSFEFVNKTKEVITNSKSEEDHVE